MRALAFADLQATTGHERCFNDPTKYLQIYRLESFFDQIEKVYDTYKCDALWDLGDTTDDRTSIPVPVIDLMCDRLESFEGKWNLKLVGNHEQFLRHTGIHAGKMFRRFFRVVEGCELIKCDKVNIFCVSFHDNNGPVIDFLRRNRDKTPALALGHFELFGCQLPGGMSASGIARSELEFVNTGLFGHVHKPQSLGKLHYIGSPFQQNWGESGEDKRVAIVDIIGDQIKLQWVPLVAFPRYRQLNFDEFLKAVTEKSEDRYKVVLKTVAETEAFYAHPLANRADEVIYDYVHAETSGTGSTAEEDLPRSKQDIIRRYLQQNPPKKFNIDLGDDEMAVFGDQISTGT